MRLGASRWLRLPGATSEGACSSAILAMVSSTHSIRTGMFLGPVANAHGNTLVNDGLWGLTFGNGANGGNANSLYLTAGLNDERQRPLRAHRSRTGAGHLGTACGWASGYVVAASSSAGVSLLHNPRSELRHTRDLRVDYTRLLPRPIPPRLQPAGSGELSATCTFGRNLSFCTICFSWC